MQKNTLDLKEVFRMSLLIDGHLVAECRARAADNGIIITTQIDASDRYTGDLAEVCDNLAGAIMEMLAVVDDGSEETRMSYHPNKDGASPEPPF